jgi:Transposase
MLAVVVNLAAKESRTAHDEGIVGQCGTMAPDPRSCWRDRSATAIDRRTRPGSCRTTDLIQKTNAQLYRAYPLKEQLRQIYLLPAATAEQLLDRWLAWARRAGCRR